MPKFQTTLLFDLDGTLIDSTPAILEGFHYAFAHLGAAEPSDEAIKRLIGHPLEVMFERLGAARDVQDFVLAYKQRYAQIFLDQTVLLSGAYEAVQEASRFANLGVVTTKTSKFSKILLQHLGIAKFFGTIVGREDVQDPKPSAEPILKALENLGISSITMSKNRRGATSKNCAAVAGESQNGSYGKTHDANEKISVAGSRDVIPGEILASDLLGSPTSDLDLSEICERNLSGLSSKNSFGVSFINSSDVSGNERGVEGSDSRGYESEACCSEMHGGSVQNFAHCDAEVCSENPYFGNIFMIGDTQLDAEAARAAGVRSVGVSCGYGSASELRAHFEFVCADAKEAAELIREISSKF